MSPPLPSELIFFVTSHCNLHCRHCFNWQNLQRSKDLSLNEIEGLARSLPTLKNLLLSGGEPFLRKDLVEICRLFVRYGRVSAIDIPTSGTLIERTVSTVKEILCIEPVFNLQVGISLDGLETFHDNNRGVEGTFNKAVECCRQLLELKKTTRRLKVNILTTLTQDNKQELLALKNYVAKNFPTLDNLYWGVARGDTQLEADKSLRTEDLEEVDRQFLAYEEQKTGSKSKELVRRFYALRRKAHAEQKQPLPCVAASKIAVVYDEGSVAPCELLPPVGNIRDESFDVIWRSVEMQRARQQIAAGSCSCTHECFLFPSFEAFLLERPLTLIKLAGMDGIVKLLTVKFRLDGLVSRIRGYIGKISWKDRREP
ncbi:MAG: radical SAM protein [Desulfuromusa sp.]|nr:radical SAM protein [Desulfuromusa sp.]